MVKKVDEYGVIRYYNNGELHREDGPALIGSRGSQVWYKNGKKHRDDGPAMIYPNGTQVWYKNGKKHRDDGPAMIYPNGTQVWYNNGENYSFNEWCELVDISQEYKFELVLKYG